MFPVVTTEHLLDNGSFTPFISTKSTSSTCFFLTSSPFLFENNLSFIIFIACFHILKPPFYFPYLSYQIGTRRTVVEGIALKTISLLIIRTKELLLNFIKTKYLWILGRSSILVEFALKIAL
jgi:hypothetical protein